ncbi:MAG: hypothetical protein PHE83_10730 [Opitutaceae bacterium]|nr:hypothetical protein [Opitutaceae bacterium]
MRPPTRFAFFRKTALCLVAGLLLAATGAAQDDPPAGEAAPANGNGSQPTISRIPGLFEIDLPKTERRGNIQFTFQPHFRDLIDNSYLRIPLGFRWGVNDHFELNSDLDTYFDHGLGRGASGYGLSQLHFGAKYAWHEWLKPSWDTSVGFNSSIPVSRPPVELTDGHNHFTPFIVLGRQVDGVKGLSGFLHTSVDFISKSSTPGEFGRNQPHSNSLTVTPGLLYDRKSFHYTLEVDCTTTSLVGQGNKNFFTIRPGVIWDLPRKLVFNARGRWLVGFNVTATFGPDGNTFGTGGRFRGEVNLTRLFRHDRQDNTPPADATSGR